MRFSRKTSPPHLPPCIFGSLDMGSILLQKWNETEKVKQGKLLTLKGILEWVPEILTLYESDVGDKTMKGMC